MKSIQKYLSIMLVIALVIGLLPVQAEAASDVRLSKKSVTLNITQYNNKTTYGKSTITVKKSKGITLTKVAYKSSNKKVAIVTSKGKVTAKKKGDTKITVTVKYKKDNKSYTKKLTYKVKVKVVNKKVKQTTQARTEKSTTTEKPTTPTTTEKQITTEKKTEQPTNQEEVTTQQPTTEQRTEVPATTEEKTERPTEIPTTQEKPIEEATTEEKSTEVSATTEQSDDPSEERIEFDYIYFSYNNGRYDIYEGIVYEQKPSTIQPGIYKTYKVWGNPETYSNDEISESGNLEIPVLDEIKTVDGIEYGIVHNIPANCISAGKDDYYELCSGRIKTVNVPALGHDMDGIWHATQNTDGTGKALQLCKRCGLPIDEYIFKYKLTNDYRYTEWVQEPTATQEGIMNIYQGAKIEGKTEEELAELYTVYDIVYADGTPDKLYGKWINDPNDNGGDYFEVYATTVPQLMDTEYYPKCQTITVELENGETAEVQGYYDTEMADEIYTLLNQYRVENGLNELSRIDALDSIADLRSAESAYTTWYNYQHSDEEDYLAHQRPNRLYLSSLMGDFYGECGENGAVNEYISKDEATGIIQATTVSAEEFMKSWKTSEGHNANMLYGNWNDVGISIFVGYRKNKDGIFSGAKEVFAIQVFN